MGVVRFLIGFGWWMLLYAALYIWWLVTVVLWLFVFGQEAKSDGSPPNPASPASIMVLLICVGLGFSTLVTLGVGLSIRWNIPVGALVALVVAAGVTILSGFYNMRLAEEQTVRMLNVNLIIAAAVILANLLTLYLTLPLPRGPTPPPLP